MRLRVKICGLTTPDTLAAALDAGADMIGLVFHPKSPRYAALPLASRLADQARGRADIVALTVDMPPAALREVCAATRPDWVQLHGRESVAGAAQAREISGAKILKAIGVATRDDLAPIAAFHAAGALPLIDAKPPKDAEYPGGHGKPFDWTILAGLSPSVPFILSGGLTPENVGDAIRTVRALGLRLEGVDVSSGVESAPGVKDAARIRAFVAASRAAG